MAGVHRLAGAAQPRPKTAAQTQGLRQRPKQPRVPPQLVQANMRAQVQVQMPAQAQVPQARAVRKMQAPQTNMQAQARQPEA